ncbi:MAG: peptidyl-prolyl cis-trans isomerase [Acidobacteriota bacterium]|nr:MAG: peptidyl-prolyl cis-trans isomerase [Acidobacteriota bacterium]
MLKFFTRLERTRNFVLLLFAVVMVGSLVLFYAPNPNTALANLAASEETAAKVAGYTITVGEIARQKENFERFSRGQSYPAKTILESLISSRITRAEAARLGLTASDAEVAAKIREDFKPEDGKPFDQARYEQNITEQFGSISMYEQSVRDSLSSRKLEAFVTSGVTVSEEAVLEEFNRRNTKFDLVYVSINPSELAKGITPTDAELREYFEKNKASYYINVPQKKIKYIFVNTNKIGEKLQLPEADLRAEYDALPADKKISGVNGQQIVLRVNRPDQEGEVFQRANEIIQRLKKDGTEVTEAGFADIAKGYSEDPATAAGGGKLSGPVRENPAKPDDPYQRLLKMKPGEVSEPILYQSRYFILRRGEEIPKTFEQARKEIEVSLRNRRAYTAAAELAQKVVDALKENKDINKTAQDFASQANMSVAEMIRETGYVKPGDDVPEIGTSPQFEEGIAPLENVGDIGERTPIQNGFAIPTLVDKKEPRDAEFEEVRSKVVDVVKLDKARAQIDEIAKKIAQGAGTASGLNSIASANGVTAKDQKDFVLGSPVGEGPTAGTSEALEKAIFAMKSGDVMKDPVKIGDNQMIVGVTKREDPKSEDFATQRSSIMDQMLGRKRATLFNDYLAAARQKLETAGKIVIYDAALAKIDAKAQQLQSGLN